MRPVAVLALLWCLLAAPADAHAWGSYRTYTRDDIMHVRDIDFAALGIDPSAVLGVPADEPWALGYHYERTGIRRFDLDLWRTDGEFVLFSGRTYYSLTDEEAARLGAGGVPLGYHLPPLLVILIVIGELLVLAALAARGIALSVRTVLVAAGVHAALALVFLFSSHMEIQTASVGWLAVFLGIAAVRALRALADEPADDEGAGDDEEDDGDAPRPRRRRARHAPPRPVEPRLHDDPFRSAPQPPPIATVPPPRPVTAAPVVHDESAPPPTILR